MKKGIRSCLTLAVLTALLWCVGPREAVAQTYYLENAAPFPIDVALLVPTGNGWYSTHWFTVAPYSRKGVTKSWAHGGKFGYYAKGRGRYSNYQWSGGTPAIVNSSAGSHPFNVNPGGYSVRVVGFKIKRGNTVRFNL